VKVRQEATRPAHVPAPINSGDMMPRAYASCKGADLQVVSQFEFRLLTQAVIH